jgi:hypothetical protein
MYESFLLERIECVDDRTFIAVIFQEHRYRFTIRLPGGFPTFGRG